MLRVLRTLISNIALSTVRKTFPANPLTPYGLADDSQKGKIDRSGGQLRFIDTLQLNVEDEIGGRWHVPWETVMPESIVTVGTAISITLPTRS